MGDTWITDMRHFPPPGEPLPPELAPARRLADYFGAIVSAASLAPSGVVVVTVLSCRRRPRRRRCEGRIVLKVQEGPGEIEWWCPRCGDNGFIRNWQGTPWDLSR